MYIYKCKEKIMESFTLEMYQKNELNDLFTIEWKLKFGASTLNSIRSDLIDVNAHNIVCI